MPHHEHSRVLILYHNSNLLNSKHKNVIKLDISLFDKYTALMDNQSVRAFFALPIPKEQKQIIKVFIDGFDQTISSHFRWVKPHQIHITIKFMPRFQKVHINPIRQILTEQFLVLQPIRLSLNKFGVFPKISSPKVLWIGLEYQNALGKIYQIVEDTMRSFEYENERSFFSPHVTIGRIKKRTSHEAKLRIGHYLQGINFEKTGEFQINQVFLFQSELTTTGPNYSQLFAIKLVD